MMWLKTPGDVVDSLWEGPLAPASAKSEEEITRGWPGQRKGEDTRALFRDLPVASIGQPEVWSLEEFFPAAEMPRLLRAKVAEADFYLVRFSCSFRPARDESEVEWARFLVHLLPDHLAQQPVAYDLHPREVTYEVKRDVRVTLGPSLKFEEVEAKVGEVTFGLQYPELQPAITAAGIGEAQPSWDYEEAKGAGIRGSKWMHLLLKVPDGSSARARLDLTADVRVKGHWLPVVAIKDRELAREHLTVKLV